MNAPNAENTIQMHETNQELSQTIKNVLRCDQKTNIETLLNEHIRSVLIKIECNKEDITNVGQLECETIKRAQ